MEKAEIIITECHRLGAELGDSESQFNLGLAYYLGEGVEEDKPEAAKWFRLAAEQGDVTAQLFLGIRLHSF